MQYIEYLKMINHLRSPNSNGRPASAESVVLLVLGRVEVVDVRFEKSSVAILLLISNFKSLTLYSWKVLCYCFSTVNPLDFPNSCIEALVLFTHLKNKILGEYLHTIQYISVLTTKLILLSTFQVSLQAIIFRSSTKNLENSCMNVRHFDVNGPNSKLNLKLNTAPPIMH